MITSQEYNPLLLAVGKEGVMSENKSATIPTNKRLLTATEVAEILDVSISTAYRIVKKLNDKLASEGKIIVPGKIAARYFYEHIYISKNATVFKRSFFPLGGEIIADHKRRKNRVMVL